MTTNSSLFSEAFISRVLGISMDEYLAMLDEAAQEAGNDNEGEFPGE